MVDAFLQSIDKSYTNDPRYGDCKVRVLTAMSKRATTLTGSHQLWTDLQKAGKITHYELNFF
jgi:hypothetical protein